MDSPAEVLARLNTAMNRRDLVAFVACFDPDYESDQPAHPDRHFRGRAQVERNWAAMFAGLPDFHAEVVRSAVDSDGFWVEWRWTGTRADGTRLDACGSCIFGVRSGRLVWGRLYMEDVELGRGIEEAVVSLADGSSRLRQSHELPDVVARRGWRYHHVGIPTSERRSNETYLERYGLYVSGFSTSPYGIEWMRFEDSSPLHPLIKSLPHVAFEVDDLEAALIGQEVISPPGSPSDGVRAAMIVVDGAPVELIWSRKQDT